MNTAVDHFFKILKTRTASYERHHSRFTEQRNQGFINTSEFPLIGFVYRQQKDNIHRIGPH